MTKFGSDNQRPATLRCVKFGPEGTDKGIEGGGNMKALRDLHEFLLDQEQLDREAYAEQRFEMIANGIKPPSYREWKRRLKLIRKLTRK